MRLEARTALYCPEYLHKKNAPNRFDLSGVIEDDEVAKERKRMGDIHEAKVIEVIKLTNLKIHQIDFGKAIEDREVETATALLDPSIDIILGGTLGAICEYELKKVLGHICPGDPDRTSRPDVLYKTGIEEGRPLWAPVDIKSHSAFDAKNRSNKVVLVDILAQDASADQTVTGRIEAEDAMQLSHYLIHLQSLGVANQDSRAGVIGIDGKYITWANLAQTTFGVGVKSETALARYYRTFAAARRIIELSLLHARDASVPNPVIPELVGGKFGCPDCQFRGICMAELLAYDDEEGHVTLLASVTPDKREDNFPDIHSIRELREATGLNPFGMKSQLRANVWKSLVPALLDSYSPFDLPAFDFEIDIDLENSMEALIERNPGESAGNDLVYLYGYGIHNRESNPDWRSANLNSIFNYSDSEQGECEVLLKMWTVLQDEVKKAETAGKTIGIFHYSPHETTWWRKFAQRHVGKHGVPTEMEVSQFISRYFVDLLPYAQKISFPTVSYSIKKLAPQAGFHWEFEDAGGAVSLVKYKIAVDQTRTTNEQEEAKEWLRRYNLDDIRATFAVRNYIRDLEL